MKNSLPRMKNSTMPEMISEAYSLSWKSVAIWMAPLLRKVSRAEISSMTKGFIFASQATMMAVKPRPPAVLMEMVWETADTARKPAKPQTAPEMAMVRI